MEITDTLPEFELSLDEGLDTEIVVVEAEEKQEEPETEQEIVPDERAKAFYEELTQRGYLDDAEEFGGTWEELDELITELPQKVLNSVIASMPEDSKQVLKFISAAGQNLNKEELKKFFVEYFEEQELPNVDTADSARAFLTKVFEEQGLKPRAIQAQLDDLEDDDTLLAEAKKELSKRGSTTDQIIAAKERENRERKANEQRFVASIQDELKTQGWKPERVAKVQSTFSNINTLMSSIASSPKAYVQLVDLLTYYDANKKEFDLSFFDKKAESKASTSLKDKITRDAFSSSGSRSKATTQNNNIDNLDNYEPII